MSPAGAATEAIGRLARLAVRARLDGPLLELCAGVLHRAPHVRAARSLGWHLGEAAGPRARVARLLGGARMLVDVRDYAHRSALLYGVYEEDVTRLVHRLATPGWTVLDVGANAGYFALVAAAAGGAGAHVVAFEPNPRMLDLLEQTLRCNPGAPVELVPAACGDRAGSVALHLSPDPRNSGLSTVLESFEDAEAIDVASLRLDEFCAQRAIVPDLVKVDVEGAEEMVLRGAEGLLREGTPTHVICEVWAMSREPLGAYMGSLGYAAYAIGPDGALQPARATDGRWDNICFRHERAGPPGQVQI